jgi:trehalose/maltose transport system substrate-binding protein
VGVTYIPRVKGIRRLAGVLGGSQIAVSRYTDHPEEAVSLVKYLTSKSELRRRALVGALSPPRMDLYNDGEILRKNPHFALAKDVYKDAAARPSTITGFRYSQVSYEFWNMTHDVLSGSVSAEKGVADLAGKLKRISRDGQW